MEQTKQAFGDSDRGFSFFNEDEAFNYVNIVGHSAGTVIDRSMSWVTVTYGTGKALAGGKL